MPNVNAGLDRTSRGLRLVAAEGPLLEQTIHSLRHVGLSAHAVMQLETARSRTPCGRRSRRRLALINGTRLIASAMQTDLSVIYEGHTIPACGISGVSTPPGTPPDGRERLLIDRIVERARGMGAAMVLLAAPAGTVTPAGFTAIPLPDLTLNVAKPSRYGAPMTMVRGGEERDIPAIVAMGRTRVSRFRLHLDRNGDLIQDAITTKRLLSGLAPAHTRQLHFFIAEEGTTAAAYVVISGVGGSWTIEECGDRDTEGARVGALLQALIAREPSERMPTITAWLPAGFQPPQISVTANAAASHVVMVRDLRSVTPLRLGADDLLFWRNDLLS